MKEDKKIGLKFAGDYTHLLNALIKTVNGLLMEESVDNTEELLKGILTLLSKRRYADRSIKLMHEVYRLDYDTFVHSLNVAMISHELASWLNWSEEDVECATLCGLLHDVGKLRVEYAILMKPGRLTEAERLNMQEHPMLGFELLKKCQAVDEHIRKVAMQHHERCDGSGYPYGLVGEQIDRFARVVAIADVYDAMTADRVYRDAMAPGYVLEQMRSECDRYDKEFFAVFHGKVKDLLAC